MGRRSARQALGLQHEELPGGSVATVERPAGRNVREHLLQLQRDYGNTAVTTAVVQRRHGHSAAASTDAPGAKPAPAPAQEEDFGDFAPKEHNKFQSWSTSDLSERAASEMDSDVKNSWYFAADLWEERWFRCISKGDSRAVALNLYRTYKKLGDDARTKFWLAVLQDKIDPRPNAPAKAEDMTGKEF
jgi:hypothetical protein